MKNTLDVTNSRVDIKEENISEFEFEDKMKQCEKGELKRWVGHHWTGEQLQEA